ncbi:MAG: hypothetical protein ACXVDI_01835 [Ktedonobacterales bacterium]
MRRAIGAGEEVGEVQWNRGTKNQSVGVNQSNPQRQSQPFELPVLPDGDNNPALARQQTPQRRVTAAPNLVGTLGGDGLLSRATASIPAVAPSTAASSSASQSSASPSLPPSDASGTLPPRAPTLTARLRAIQPPDVARQAVSELGVLARELATLPDNLEAAGLARTHKSSYFEAIRGYQGLARQAWLSVAEERLEQSGADPEYRQRAILIARRITQLQQECRTASENVEFKLPRQTSPLWRRRVALVRSGLRVWQDRLAPTPDPREMGRGLFLLRGYLGLATAGDVELLLLVLLQGVAAGSLGFLSVGLILLLTVALLNGALASITGLAVGLFALAVAWALLFFGTRGPVPLSLLLGASVFSPTRSTRNEHSGSPIIAIALRAWWLVIGFLGMFAIIGGLVIGGAFVGISGVLVQPADTLQAVALAGGVVTYASVLPAVLALTSLALLGLPVLLLTVIRFSADFAGSPGWVPMARRSGLELALMIHASATAALIVGLWLGITALNWLQPAIVELSLPELGGVSTALTPRGIILLLALALVYLLLIDLPFRVGMRRWRRAWLADLAGRRADVESHVRRLSVTDPRSGTQDTSEENLRAMQYDLVLLQFYRDKMEEAERTADAPFGLRRMIAALIIAAVAALLLDAGAMLLARLLNLS